MEKNITLRITGQQGEKTYTISLEEDKAKGEILGIPQLKVLKSNPEPSDFFFAFIREEFADDASPCCCVDSFVIKKYVKHEFWTVIDEKVDEEGNQRVVIQKVILLNDYRRCKTCNTFFNLRTYLSRGTRTERSAQICNLVDQVRFDDEFGHFNLILGKTNIGSYLANYIGTQSMLYPFRVISDMLVDQAGKHPIRPAVVSSTFLKWAKFMDRENIENIKSQTYRQIWIQTLKIRRDRRGCTTSDLSESPFSEYYIIFAVDNETILDIIPKSNDCSSIDKFFDTFKKSKTFNQTTFIIDLDSNLRNVIKKHYENSRITVYTEAVIFKIGQIIEKVLDEMSLIASRTKTLTTSEKNVRNCISSKTVAFPRWQINLAEKIRYGYVTDPEKKKIDTFWNNIAQRHARNKMEKHTIEVLFDLYNTKEELARLYFENAYESLLSFLSEKIESGPKVDPSDPDILRNELEELWLCLSNFQREILDFLDLNNRHNPNIQTDLSHMRDYLEHRHGCTEDAVRARILYGAELSSKSIFSEATGSYETAPKNYVFYETQKFEGFAETKGDKIPYTRRHIRMNLRGTIEFLDKIDKLKGHPPTSKVEKEPPL